MTLSLQHALQRLGFTDLVRFTPAQIAALCQATSLKEDALALALLPQAQHKAWVPVSGFRVGALAMGNSGHWYLGANLEVEGLPLNSALHAEQAAIGHAALWGETGIRRVVVSASPCGHCRQFMQELNQECLTLVLEDARLSLAELLPHAFGPADLGQSYGMLNGPAGTLSVDSRDPLVLAALAEANASYAPYSHNRAGVALLLNDGRVCRGRYLENAAFNPSLGPMQLALSQLMLQGATPANISRALMVEADAGICQHDAAAQLLGRLGTVTLERLVLQEKREG